MIQLQFAFSESNFRQVLNQWGNDGIGYFKKTLWLDYLFPLGYGLFLAGCIARRYHWIAFLPLVGAMFDGMENTLHYYLVTTYPSLSPGLILTASFCATFKWLSILGAFGLILL